MQRRHFLQTALMLLPMSGALKAGALSSGVKPDMLDRIGGDELVRSIGRSYHLSGRDSADLILSERGIRTDFARGNTVNVDGWVLSRTEAEACARFYLAT